MKIIVVGGGETGLALANLMEKEAEITIIEKDEKVAKELANRVNVLVIHGDGTDISILREADIENTDVLVTTTADDTVNLMVSQIAKAENVQKIIPIVKKPKNEELFSRLGISSIVSVVGSNVSDIKRILRTYGDARVIATLGEGKVQVIQQVIGEKSQLINQKAKIKNAVVATIYREGESIIPTPESTLKNGDVLLLTVKTKHLHKVLETMKGERLPIKKSIKKIIKKDKGRSKINKIVDRMTNKITNNKSNQINIKKKKVNGINKKKNQNNGGKRGK
jgi:trk system potassium uptake protein